MDRTHVYTTSLTSSPHTAFNMVSRAGNLRQPPYRIATFGVPYPHGGKDKALVLEIAHDGLEALSLGSEHVLGG